MGKDRWTEDEVLGLAKDRDDVLDRIAGALSERGDVVFAAKLGFGTPRIDLVTTDRYRTLVGYVLKLPVVDDSISSVPYYQGFGESIFLPDQMLDEAYMVIPDLEISEDLAFTRSPNPEYRIRNAAYEAGIAAFDRAYTVKKIREPKGSMAKQYLRLKLELLDCILNFAEFTVGEGKEEQFKAWQDWVKSELESLGAKKLLDKASAEAITKKILGEKNYHSIKMEISEAEMDSEPRPIPVFNITGTGFYLGDDKEFSLQLSRISGIVLRGDY
jgi:hypothetical protein